MLIGIIVLISLVIALPVGLNTGFWAALGIFVAGVLLQALAVFLYLLHLCRKVDQSVPQEEIDPHYKKVTDLILESVLPILRIRIKCSGLEKVPQQGRFLLICNHCNDSDPIILMRVFGKYEMAFISKRENSTMFVIGPMMHKLLCQLINRENDREALKTILKCIEILKTDKASVAVFPEGGIITEDGCLHHFKPGVFKIAQKANVPIVVCTLKNTKDVVHNILHFKGSKVELNVLEVIPAETVQAQKTVEIAQYCHDLMAKELGPDLVAD
jgi:1-acyl-sn-glycerol-3-phosphate acyltransferase